MFPDYTTLLVRFARPRILLVTLNRPEVGNARNTAMGRELFDLWTRVAEIEPERLRAIVLTGAGERIFCAGADLKERAGMPDAEWRAQHALFERARAALVSCPTPVIAAVNGHAYGGGLETVLCCDFAYAAPGVRFALPEVTRGIMPGGGGTQLLPRSIGEHRAMEIILTGRPFSAEQALAWGVINAIHPLTTLLEETLGTAEAIAANAPISVRQAKKAIHHGLQIGLTEGLLLEIEAYAQLVPTDDRREGVQAFREKRPPVFKGR